MRVLVIDETPLRASILEEGLREAGLEDVTILSETRLLMRQIVEIDPDVILIDLENPSRDVLESMFQVSRTVERPIGMFVDQSDAGMIERAVEAGVSTYIVDGLRKERVKAIVEMTVSRFNAFNRLKRELADTKRALADRTSIDRAKAILMRRHTIDEPAAYAMLRRAAMDQHQTIADVARALVSASQLLEKRP
ncbi:ANTAR domain-containing protein [Acuticoccus sp. MNP-M23]|uniref:ANTAR domain-containing response regulator n=1 Tax=Acuticoccus sp. MNP-M23 TaxID=3072793 RepID=UPI002814D7A4|nr:ANTAR domain-containing protein [Acuticoccus sp. MNP-M23]WMS43487.1 ANTAR domain-containing protein [Acuticoccus sp. MNP-M23]